MPDATDERQLPRYRCHKMVWALKIAQVDDAVSGGGRLHIADAGYAPLTVPVEYMVKHKPQAGGYYVVYEDGYKSFSPAEAFERGYTLIG